MLCLPVDLMGCHILQIKGALPYTSQGSLTLVGINPFKRLFRRTAPFFSQNSEYKNEKINKYVCVVWCASQRRATETMFSIDFKDIYNGSNQQS